MTSSPTLWHGPWGQKLWNISKSSKVPMIQVWMLSDERLLRYTHMWNCNTKLWRRVPLMGRKDKLTNIWMERQRLYTPRHTSYTRGIKMQMQLLSQNQLQSPYNTFNLNIILIPFYLAFPISIHPTAYEPRHDKTNKMSVRPAKTQISLGIRPVWSESSLCAQWVAKDPRFLHADSEDSDQTGWMSRLIWVFAGHTLILFVLSCRSSHINIISDNDRFHRYCHRRFCTTS